MENQLEVLRSSLAGFEQKIASLSEAQGDHPYGLVGVRAVVRFINANVDQGTQAVLAGSN